jgi:hypothetical protein
MQYGTDSRMILKYSKVSLKYSREASRRLTGIRKPWKIILVS